MVCDLFALEVLALYRFGFGWFVVGSWLCSLSVLVLFVWSCCYRFLVLRLRLLFECVVGGFGGGFGDSGDLVGRLFWCFGLGVR